MPFFRRSSVQRKMMYANVALGDGYHRTMLQFIRNVCEDLLNQRSDLGAT